MNLLFTFIFVAVSITSVFGAVIPDEEVDQQGLYSKSDHVVILTPRNFDKKVYGQKHATLLQFYNSHCGHCKKFEPKFKALANAAINWENVIKLAVLDCSVEENNGICREFDVMSYPSLRYLHENYVKGNGNVGEKIQITETADELKESLIVKMQNEQSMGHLNMAPSLNIASYATYESAIKDVPRDTDYTFLVFENESSFIGAELGLDVSDYQHVRVKRVYDTSELAKLANVHHFPGIVAVGPDMKITLLAPKYHTKEGLFLALQSYLKSVNYELPKHHNEIDNNSTQDNHIQNEIILPDTDAVYYNDLEKTIKFSLHTEITKYKVLNGEPLQALLDYLDILIGVFPSRGNLREFLMDLRTTLATRTSWNGNDLYELVKRLEEVHAPVYITNLEYIGCRGSQQKYRGYSCGVWTLFHTLTVNSVQKPGTEGPKVLRVMHGYIKYFFGCTECSQHFQDMAARNRIFDVKENDKAVLWLWISHNEVNLRLAGDITEDPNHPKIQFPSVSRCKECRQARGAWNLPAVFEYLQQVYSANNIQDYRRSKIATAPSPLSNLDIGMLSLLYILSFIILVLVIKYFFTRRFYRKRHYKHGLGKV